MKVMKLFTFQDLLEEFVKDDEFVKNLDEIFGTEFMKIKDILLNGIKILKDKNISNDDFPVQSKCHGMIKVACATNYVRLASPMDNVEEIAKIIQDSKKHDLDILLFPELCISGYSCGDLFYLDTLLNSVLTNIEKIRKHNPFRS